MPGKIVKGYENLTENIIDENAMMVEKNKRCIEKKIK